jgi:hypothetical protein
LKINLEVCFNLTDCVSCSEVSKDKEVRMSKGSIIGVMLVAAILSLASATRGQELVEKPLQIALWNPIQIYPEDTGIKVFRLSILYGKNVSVKGLDLGMVNRCTGGITKSWQIGLFNWVEGDFLGWQYGIANFTKGKFTGLQSHGFNIALDAEGVQIGVVNRAERISGFQLGFINWADSMYGLQIGLINYIASKETLPFFVIINWSF